MIIKYSYIIYVPKKNLFNTINLYSKPNVRCARRLCLKLGRQDGVCKIYRLKHYGRDINGKLVIDTIRKDREWAYDAHRDVVVQIR